jgi:hypothetical protein
LTTPAVDVRGATLVAGDFDADFVGGFAGDFVADFVGGFA